MILLGSQVGTPAISPAGSNFDTMRALKSMPLRYYLSIFEDFVFVERTRAGIYLPSKLESTGQLARVPTWEPNKIIT